MVIAASIGHTALGLVVEWAGPGVLAVHWEAVAKLVGLGGSSLHPAHALVAGAGVIMASIRITPILTRICLTATAAPPTTHALVLGGGHFFGGLGSSWIIVTGITVNC